MFEKMRRKKMEKTRSRSTRPVVYEQDLRGYVDDRINANSPIRDGMIERKPCTSKMTDEEYNANSSFNWELCKTYSGMYELIDGNEPLAFRYRHTANHDITLADAWRITNAYAYDCDTAKKKYRGLDTLSKAFGLEYKIETVDDHHIIVDFTSGTSENGWINKKNHLNYAYTPRIGDLDRANPKMYYFDTEKVPGNEGVLPLEIRPAERHKDYAVDSSGFGGMRPGSDSTIDLETAKRIAIERAKDQEFRSSVSGNKYRVTTVVKQTDDKGFWDALRDVLPWELRDDQKKVYQEKFESLKVGESLLVPMWAEYTDYKGNRKKVGKNGYAEIVRTASRKRR